MRNSPGSEPATRVILRCAVYYTALLGIGALVWRWLPHGGAFAPASLDAIFGKGGLDAAVALEGTGSGQLDDVSMAITVAVAMLAAVLLSIPVAWVYLLTRAKRGYQQSVVQLLIMLPTVVAGVVVLVKNSIALAFSLAGIVAAVRFRNSLDDSKDAVYVFLATAIGLAAAVNLPVAVVLSIGFNMTVLFLWYTDFGSAPVELDGRIAEKRLKRAQSLARTGTFVAHMDEEVLRNMTRDQLQGVAERAWKRASAVTGEDALPALVPDARLLLHTRNPMLTRRVIEPRLQEFTRQWRFKSLTSSADLEGGEDFEVLEYSVQLKKKFSPD
ncbi:MAG TPA: DUF4956 domain-containing protein, partial [Gemmatimonas sp.]|nr:DUF4956 domain-containing protein [Gemmatimonas sp.]